METNFDYELFKKEALSRLKNGEELSGKDGVLLPLIKDILEASLEGELSAHLLESRPLGNRKNGKTVKQVKSSHGSFELAPHDREGSFEAELVKKRR